MHLLIIRKGEEEKCQLNIKCFRSHGLKWGLSGIGCLFLHFVEFKTLCVFPKLDLVQCEKGRDEEKVT